MGWKTGVDLRGTGLWKIRVLNSLDASGHRTGDPRRPGQLDARLRANLGMRSHRRIRDTVCWVEGTPRAGPTTYN